MTSIWDTGDAGCTPDQCEDMVRGCCCACADVLGCLQAPADAFYAWLDALRCKVYKKIDRVGDKAVIRILEVAFALREQLGVIGPAYPGTTPEPGTPIRIAPDLDVPALDLIDCASSSEGDVYTAAPESATSSTVESDTVSGAEIAQRGIQLVPVDLDTPLAFLFGEASARWHPRAVAWTGKALADVIGSKSLQELIDARSSGRATAMPARIADIP